MDFSKFVKRKVRDTAVSLALALNRAEKEIIYEPKKIEINKVNYGSQLVNDLMQGEVTQNVKEFVKRNYQSLRNAENSHKLKEVHQEENIEKKESVKDIIFVRNKPDYDEEKEKLIPNIHITPPSNNLINNFSEIEYHVKEKTLHFNTKLTNNLYDSDFKVIERVNFFYNYNFYVLDVKFLQKIPISGKFVFNVLKEEIKEL